MNVAEIVTQKIIDKLQSGIIPWIKPWGSAHAVSYATGRRYKGLNILLLSKPGEYLTFKKCSELGGSIKKGAKSEMIVFWKVDKKEVMDDETGEKTIKMKPTLRYYNVFHLDDCLGIESKLPKVESTVTAIESIEEFARSYMERENIRYLQTHCDKAFYSSTDDYIQLPLTEQFESPELYHGVLFHEMIHSTGHENRLNRLELKDYHSGKDIRSKEELTAEIGSATLLNMFNLETEKTFNNNTGYVQSWVQVLKNDVNMIISASSRAQKAVDYITGDLSIEPEEEV